MVRFVLFCCLVAGQTFSALAGSSGCDCNYRLYFPAKTLEPRRENNVGIGETLIVEQLKPRSGKQEPACEFRVETDPPLPREFLDTPSRERVSLRASYTTGTLIVRVIGQGQNPCSGKILKQWKIKVLAPQFFEHNDPKLTQPYTTLKPGPPHRLFGGRWKFTLTLHPTHVSFDHLPLEEYVHEIDFSWPDGTRNLQPAESIYFSTQQNLSSDNAGLRRPNTLSLLDQTTATTVFDLVVDNRYKDPNGNWITFESGEIHRHIVKPNGEMRVEIIHSNGSESASMYVGPWQ